MATLWTNKRSQNDRRAGQKWPSAPYRTVAFLDHVRGRRLVNNATAGWCKYFGKMAGLMNFSEEHQHELCNSSDGGWRESLGVQILSLNWLRMTEYFNDVLGDGFGDGSIWE